MVRLGRYLAQKTLVVQKVLGGRHALSVTLLEQVTRGFRSASEGVFRVGRLPAGELRASFLRLQFIQEPKTSVQLPGRPMRCLKRNMLRCASSATP